MIIYLMAVSTVFKCLFIFAPQNNQILLLKTIKNRISHTKHIKILYMFNLPLLIVFVTAFVIDPQCQYELSFYFYLIFIFLTSVQYYIVRAIVVKQRYLQKSDWNNGQLANIQRNNQIFQLMNNPHPQWLQKCFQDSNCYFTYLKIGALKVPLQDQLAFHTYIKLNVSEKDKETIKFVELDQSLGSTGNYYYEGQMHIYLDQSSIQDQNSQLIFERYGYGRYYSIEEGNFIIMEGQWKKNKLDGFGRCIDNLGNYYVGKYANG